MARLQLTSLSLSKAHKINKNLLMTSTINTNKSFPAKKLLEKLFSISISKKCKRKSQHGFSWLVSINLLECS